MNDTTSKKQHFIRQIIEDDLAKEKHTNIITRFPPEPNGYLHIGHTKSICLNFGLAQDYQGSCFLRFDDTNPCKEEEEYVQAIIEDIRWLGYDWDQNLTHASDYYQNFYDAAVHLIKQGRAYVDSLSMEQIKEYRGTLETPGKDSPYRSRSIDENLNLFKGMKDGKFKEGEHVLRAKIDMSSGNINMRDPIIYRIRYAFHQRTGNDWCIYPMYDFAHPLSDAQEHISHSLCTLEFQDHRPLYDWFIKNCPTPSKPRQIEFARLNFSHTITSKRKLRYLVEQRLVDGWDDPRLATIKAIRRRGFPPAAIREFCEMIGVSKSNSIIDMSVLEQCVRDELNQHAPRAMCVMNPLKIIIENYPEDKTERLIAANHPQDDRLGVRHLPFTKELYIDRDDFMEHPPKKFFRLAPGKEVRLRNAYVIKCEAIMKDEKTGEVTALHCSYDPDTLGKNPQDRKVKGVIQWVSAAHTLKATVRLYDRLFKIEKPGADEDFAKHLNPESLIVMEDCLVEPGLKEAAVEQAFQFERIGYFCVDKDSRADNLVFNRIVALRDTWSKISG